MHSQCFICLWLRWQSTRNSGNCISPFWRCWQAHLDVLNVLLQILEDGRLTDSQVLAIFGHNSEFLMASRIVF